VKDTHPDLARGLKRGDVNIMLNYSQAITGSKDLGNIYGEENYLHHPRFLAASHCRSTGIPGSFS
jgi:hypothetical protein